MITILNPPKTESNPHVIVRTSKPSDATYQSESRAILGEFARVSIRSGEDWQFVRMLAHGVDYFAPSTGDGLLIKAHLLKQ